MKPKPVDYGECYTDEPIYGDCSIRLERKAAKRVHELQEQGFVHPMFSLKLSDKSDGRYAAIVRWFNPKT